MDSWNAWHLLVVVVYVVVVVVPCWRIVGKAGYAGAWSLLVLVPLVNVVLLWVFAFAKWPNERTAA
jgi:hypothetical protein